jgi:menaquinone-9 beta-reductase
MPPDLAIVGAGPSGTSAAWRLARGGARVTLFDASHPREKPCGGGLTGRALALVRESLGGRRVDGVVVRGLRFGSGEPGQGRTTVLSLPADEAFVVVGRRALDLALLEAAEAAGARLVRERVLDVEVTGRRVAIVTTRGRHDADAVLGADGATSLVRRRVLAPFTRAQFSVTSGGYVHGTSSDQVVIRSFGAPPGYLWSFPRPDHLAVGVCAPADRVTSAVALRPVLDAWLTHALPARPEVRRYSWPIPSLSHADLTRLRVSGDRWMLAGDAAGLVDPLTREGIYYALASGRLAADAWLDGGPPGTAYHERVHDELVPELARAASLQASFFSSGFSNLLVEALARSARVRDIMADLVAGRQAYRSLRRRLVATREVGLAWRLAVLQVKDLVRPHEGRGAM